LASFPSLSSPTGSAEGAEFLQTRIADKSFLRLIGKCLRVGILDNEQYDEPDIGTVQGSTLSPMLGNIFLHYVLDVWFEREVRPRMRGKVHLWRFADDFVIGFQRQEERRPRHEGAR
jgi:retron-type reverse transcriptase